MSELSDSLREVMRGWPTGVAVVTARDREYAHGMTVNSLTSVSLDPPVITVSLAVQTRTWRLVTASKKLGVTFLAQGQQHLADIFAGKISEEEDRFTGLETFTLASDVPLLKAGRAHLDCVILQEVPLPKSTLFVAEVVAARSDLSIPPLVYLNRGYRKVSD